MSRDRSLDEFLPGDETTAPDDADGEADPGRHDVESGPDAGDGANGKGVTPIATTYDWSPDGARCGACGATVEARWRDGDALVCADCKEW